VAAGDTRRGSGHPRRGFIAELVMHRSLYGMMLPGALFFLLFSYLPMFGIVIAFKDYKIGQGVFQAPWTGFSNFTFFFTSGAALRVTMNTLYLNTLFISIGLVAEIAIALVLNEVRNRAFKRVAQSIILLPNFMSWIVVSVIMQGMFSSSTGLINATLARFGIQGPNWYGNADLWPPLLVAFRVWKGAGFGSIIYLATIANIDPQLYESATIDGANRTQQMLHITLPLLVPTAIMLTILAVGKIFYGDVGMIYGLAGDNALLFRTTDVIDTYVLRSLRSLGDLGMAAAVGLWQSVMGFVLVLASNRLSKLYGKEAGLF
jgi:putative aldouronate transport system permease protein